MVTINKHTQYCQVQLACEGNVLVKKYVALGLCAQCYARREKQLSRLAPPPLRGENSALPESLRRTK